MEERFGPKVTEKLWLVGALCHPKHKTLSWLDDNERQSAHATFIVILKTTERTSSWQQQLQKRAAARSTPPRQELPLGRRICKDSLFATSVPVKHSKQSVNVFVRCSPWSWQSRSFRLGSPSQQLTFITRSCWHSGGARWTHIHSSELVCALYLQRQAQMLLLSEASLWQAVQPRAGNKWTRSTLQCWCSSDATRPGGSQRRQGSRAPCHKVQRRNWSGRVADAVEAFEANVVDEFQGADADAVIAAGARK